MTAREREREGERGEKEREKGVWFHRLIYVYTYKLAETTHLSHL